MWIVKLGEQSNQIRSSDEDDIIFVSSKSNYIGSSDKDEANNLLNESQASGFVDTDLTAEAVWLNITKGARSNRTKREWSIKIKEEQVEENGVMNDVGNGGDLVLMWHIWKEKNDRWMEENHSLYLDFNSQNEFMTETVEQPSDLIIPFLSGSTRLTASPQKEATQFLYIMVPIGRKILAGNHGFGRDAMILLKHKILKTIMLRRTKKGRAADLGLPPRIVTLCKDCFDVKEEDYYRSLWDESRAQFNIYIQAGTLMNNYANIFNQLTHIRQVVDHPYLVECSSSVLARSRRTTNVVYVEQPCGLCHDPVEDPIWISRQTMRKLKQLSKDLGPRVY
ncbi:hypothetical protein RDI58_013583 [Solanum bulbocastanum]|uniref:Uncharacterized protein n=1 Tax=Solanum bulbocastanum TaxID=147425 RepID=A0AAN8TJT5_SOLBU